MSRWGWLAALTLGLLAGCGSPVVGGECVNGFSVCGGQCVDMSTDPQHCGTCDTVCQTGRMCLEGHCSIVGGDAAVPDGGTLDGGLPDGALPDGGTLDGSMPDGGRPDGGTMDGSVLDGSLPDGGTMDGGVLDGSLPDGGTMDGSVLDGSLPDGGTMDGSVLDGGSSDGSTGPQCNVGQILCSGACINPQTDRNHCGSCANACASTDYCASGVCTPYCNPPLSLCGQTCIDLSTDPDNCGVCGMRCPSGICTNSMCSAGAIGHIVVIGHDYVTNRAVMNEVAGNAVFLGSAPNQLVRVLAYEGDSTAASIQGTNTAIDAHGGTWQRTVATADLVPLDLAQADVFLIYSQQGATDAQLQALGTQWATALGTFVRSGGVVVVFDGGESNQGTWQILASAGMFNATAQVNVTNEILQVVAPGDAVAPAQPTYRAEADSVRFVTTESGAVVADATGPVVLHLVVVP